MPREITDQEYDFLKGRAQVADFVESIYNDPALTREAKALIKKKYPQMQIPDYDIEERIEQRLDKERKEREENESKRTQEERDKHFKDVRSKTQKEYGFTDEGMADIEKFMLERNIGDYEVAASYRAAKEPKQSDADQDSGRDHYWNHSQQEGFAEISKEPERWAEREILGAIRRDNERARGGR